MKGMQYFMSCEMYLTFLHISGPSHEIQYNIISWDISRKCLDFTEFCIPSLASRLSEFTERIWYGVSVCQLRLLPHNVNSLCQVLVSQLNVLAQCVSSECKSVCQISVIAQCVSSDISVLVSVIDQCVSKCNSSVLSE